MHGPIDPAIVFAEPEVYPIEVLPGGGVSNFGDLVITGSMFRYGEEDVEVAFFRNEMVLLDPPFACVVT